MSDHFDASDPRTDICDLYLFPADHGDGSVLVLDVNPEPSREVNIDPAASYEIKIDADGDKLADLAFHVLFEADGGETRASVYRSAGAAAQGTGRVGDPVIVNARVSLDRDVAIAEASGYRFFAGVRSEPHFKDPKGLHNGFQFTGEDPLAKRNVFGIVLEVPRDALPTTRPIRVWARTMAPEGGDVVQTDQAGRPGVNNTFNTDEADNAAFCRTGPAEQEAAFGDKFVAFLRSLGYLDAEAARLGRDFLPDWLVYDPSEPAGYPNGRLLTDDTADLIVALLTRGRITSDGVGPHTDLLDEFPYLGPPHEGLGS